MRLGVLTGGGDCPGLNAAIRAVVARAEGLGHEVWGISSGWEGVLERSAERLTWEKVDDILDQGGTVLGSSRTNPLKMEDGLQQVTQGCRDLGLGALIVIGGDDTLSVASQANQAGLACVGVPKTIDNDVQGTDFCIGFNTAATLCADAVGRIKSTARSHGRAILLEVMGRYAGWLALYAGVAGGAHLTLLPEFPLDVEAIGDCLRERARRVGYSVVVVAEGFGRDQVEYSGREIDQFGHALLGGVSAVLATEIERRAGVKTRYTILGYVQRGGSPTLFDKILATRLGLFAVELLERKEYGTMAVLQGTEVTAVPLTEVLRGPKLVDRALYEELVPHLERSALRVVPAG